MPQKQVPDMCSTYVPQLKIGQKLVERLTKLSEMKDHSINYLVVEAILEYLDRQEKTGGKKGYKGSSARWRARKIPYRRSATRFCVRLCRS